LDKKMGHWGVKSYEHDEAAEALDAGFDQVHGALYEELMDDRNALTFEQVQKKLADSRTLDASIEVRRRGWHSPASSFGMPSWEFSSLKPGGWWRLPVSRMRRSTGKRRPLAG
jgi:hypothetical protein